MGAEFGMEAVVKFLEVFKHYLIEVLPALVIGFFLSGLIHELIPTRWVERYLGRRGASPILYATITGPITSYGTILVLRKEFGRKILSIYLGIVCLLSLALGYLFSLLW